MHEMNLADLGYQGQDHYYLLRGLDTVVGLVGENGRLEEGYGYDAYGLMARYNFLPSDFNADRNVNVRYCRQWTAWHVWSAVECSAEFATHVVSADSIGRRKIRELSP